MKPVPLEGEDEGMARARLLNRMRTDAGMRLLLRNAASREGGAALDEAIVALNTPWKNIFRILRSF